ncbi:MAG TPA: DUF4404 family protein [Nevskiaceae bacterium]|nr:DUF4404 family protein [Nevskiaceae bacterium]
MNEPIKHLPPGPVRPDPDTVQRAIEDLRQESSVLRNRQPEPAQRIDQLAARFEQVVRTNATPELHEALRSSIGRLIKEFETQHPAVTATLGRLLESLGNTGI